MGLRILLLCTLFSVNYFSISAMYCSSPYDIRCDSDQVCCNNVCIYGSHCSGYGCSSDYDCTLNEVCCDSTCSNYCSNNVIIGAVVSIIFGIFFFCLVFVCCRRRRRLQTVQRPILGQRVITRTTTSTTTRRPVPNYPQHRPYQGQQPYDYQQGYVQQPPQYPAYGATNPIAGAYQSGSNPQPPTYAAPTAQPPPYEEFPAVVAMGKENKNQKNNYSQASAPPM